MSMLSISTEISNRLLERLGYIKIIPQNIINWSSELQYNQTKLQELYPHANITNIEDVKQLTTNSNSVDLFYSNCKLTTFDDYLSLFAAIKHILTNDGLFLFSTVGPKSYDIDSLQDMHTIGDIMLKIEFNDPVVDSEIVQLEYKNIANLAIDLNALNLNPDLLKKQKSNYQLEIIYGIAWGSKITKQITNNTGKIKVPLSSIKY